MVIFNRYKPYYKAFREYGGVFERFIIYYYDFKYVNYYTRELVYRYYIRV